MPIILANDEIKKEIPGYEPDKSWLVHREADKILNNKFKEYINSGQIKHVIFMAGGAASGKTEFVESKKDWEGGDEVLVIDGTLSSA